MTKTKRITDFRVSWTADHAQYYPGHSVGSGYTHSATGVGETLREAFDDAITQLIEQTRHMFIRPSVDEWNKWEAQLLAKLTSQVKEPAMLDWDIVRAKCPAVGEHDDDGTTDNNPDCAVCAGEWHYYVNVDVKVAED